MIKKPYQHLVLLLITILLGACASSPRYTVTPNAPTATVIVDDNINAATTWKSQSHKNPIGILFKAIDSLNATIPGRHAAIDGVDNLPTKGQVSHLKVDAGQRNIHLIAGLSNVVLHGIISYNFEPEHEYQIRVQVADTLSLKSADPIKYRAELRDLAKPDSILETVIF